MLSRRELLRVLQTLVILCAMTGILTSAHAGEFQVSAHTISQNYELVRTDGDVAPKRRLTQYLQLNGYDLLSDGGHQLSFQSSMRVDTDFALIDADFGEKGGRDFGLERRRFGFHLLYAYLEGRDLWNHLSFKVGRQLYTDVLGWYDFDGVSASVRIWNGIYAEVYGGLEVKQDVLPINDSAFDPDGTSPQSTGVFEFPVYVIGAALRYENLTDTQARVSYRRTFWNPTVGVESERLGAHLNQRLFERYKLYGGAIYNFFISDFDQAEGGFEVMIPEADLTLSAEYFRLKPWFDADSIFNVFDIRAYQDARLRIGYAPFDDLYASLRGGVRFYGRDQEGTSEAGLEIDPIPDEFATDYNVNLRLQVRYRPGLGIWTGLTHQSDFGFAGQQHYTAVSATTPFYYDLFAFSGRVLHIYNDAVFTRALTDTHAFGANLSGKIKLSRYGTFELYVEEAINPFVASEFRIYAMLDLDFWF